jgi:hypothetical protein
MIEDSMLFWYPKIKILDIPQPKTEIYEIPKNILENLCEENMQNLDMNAVKEVANRIGYPLFLRTDLASGKFFWKRSCFVEKEEDLKQHIFEVISFNQCADICGLPFEALVFREYIPMKNLFTAFYGEMPVNPEIRFFVKDGEVKCWHWYWCCCKDTEVLTDNGFKKFKDLIKEKIFTLNPKTRKIELLPFNKVISYHYKGKMIHISDKTFDMLVTPDHKLPVFTQNNKKINLIKAEDLKYNYKIPRTGIWKGKKRERIKIGDLTFRTSDFFEFMGYYISEGSIGKSITSPNIILSQIPKKQKIITDCLERMKIEHKIYGKNITISKIQTKYRALYDYLLKLGKSYEKFVPKELKEYSPEYLKNFLNAYCFGDGYIDNTSKFDSIIRLFSTSSYKLANDLCEIILKTGKRPSIYQKHKKSKFFIKKWYRTKHPVFTVVEGNTKNFCYEHPSSRKNKNKVKIIDYDDMVYCVSMPQNHIIYIKRNGKCSWTGNCEEAIKQPSVSNWKEILENEKKSVFGNEILWLTADARKVSKVLDGYWSVDFCKAKNDKWILIDCAIGKNSWHPEDCKYAKYKKRGDLI